MPATEGWIVGWYLSIPHVGVQHKRGVTDGHKSEGAAREIIRQVSIALDITSYQPAV